MTTQIGFWTREQAEEMCRAELQALIRHHPERAMTVYANARKKRRKTMGGRLDERAEEIEEHRRDYAEQVRDFIDRARYVQKQRPLPAEFILKTVARKHGLTVKAIKSASRHHYIMPARFEACYEIRRLTPYSLPKIGKIMGGRDHTTVLHAIKTHAIRNGLPRLDRPDPLGEDT